MNINGININVSPKSHQKLEELRIKLGLKSIQDVLVSSMSLIELIADNSTSGDKLKINDKTIATLNFIKK